MLHPQWRDFLYQLLQRRMQMSVRSNNMMPFYKTFIAIEVGHPTTCLQYKQRSRLIIPFADERLRPGIKTSGSYITYR